MLLFANTSRIAAQVNNAVEKGFTASTSHHKPKTNRCEMTDVEIDLQDHPRPHCLIQHPWAKFSDASTSDAWTVGCSPACEVHLARGLARPQRSEDL